MTLPLAFPAAGPHDVQAAKAEPAKAAKDKGQARQKNANLIGIKAEAQGGRARVILSLDGKSDFASDEYALPGKEKGKRGLVVEFKSASLSPKVAVSEDPNGPVSHIRVTPRGQGKLRVEMDLSGSYEYAVTTQDSPYRVVIDLSREGKGVAASNAKDESPAKAGKTRAVAEAARGRDGVNPWPPAVTPASFVADEPAVRIKQDKPAPYRLQKGGMRQADTLVRQLGLTVRTVMIDAGHGGKDNGATGARGVHEKDVNLALAKVLGGKLTAMGFTVRYTRDKDVFVPLSKRTEMANDAHADLFISIHCNAHDQHDIKGLETYSLNLARTKDEAKVAARENAAEQRKIGDLQNILTDLMLNSKIKESDDLAGSVHGSVIAGLSKTAPIRDHGKHEAPFYVLMGARMPAVLVEVGYVTNPEEAANLTSKAYLDQLASSLAHGVVAYKSKIEHYASL